MCNVPADLPIYRSESTADLRCPPRPPLPRPQLCNNNINSIVAQAHSFNATPPHSDAFYLKVPNPSTINQIAAHLKRNGSSGQLDGSVLLRGFIYGSDFHYSKKSRIAIPAAFFGPFDSQSAPACDES